MRPAASASAAVKAPCMNSPRMISSGMAKKAARQGIDSSSVNSMVRFCACAAPCVIAAGDTARHLRQNDRAGGNADDADRQLIDAVGVIERRDRAGGQEAGDDGVGEQRKLHAHRADGRRSERTEEFAHVGIELGPAQRGERAGAPGIATDQQQLQHAGDQHAPGRRMAGAGKEPDHRERRHHREVEKDRRGGGGGEALQRIEDAAVERDQRDQQQIRKGDARELDRERIAARIFRKTRRQDVDHLRSEQQRQGQQHDLACQQQGENAVGKQAGPLRTPLLAQARIGRHKGGVEGALGEDGAEMIGQPQRHEEGVGGRPGAQHRRQHDVAEKAGDPREQRVAADREDAFNHRSVVPK